jgi:hypothetical protein
MLSPLESSASAAPAGGATLTDDQKAELEKELTLRYEKKLTELQQQLDSAKSATGAATGGPSDEEIQKKIAGAVEEALKNVPPSDNSELLAKIQRLESIINEYKIFEDDLSQVKKFKSENELLKQKIDQSAGASISAAPSALAAAPAAEPVATPTPPPAAAVAPAPTAAPAAPAAAPAAAAAPVAATPAAESMSLTGTQAISQNEIDQLFANIDASKSSDAAAQATGQTEQVEKPKSELLSPENADALAEAMPGDENLMKEFEKLLSERQDAAPPADPNPSKDKQVG